MLSQSPSWVLLNLYKSEPHVKNNNGIHQKGIKAILPIPLCRSVGSLRNKCIDSIWDLKSDYCLHVKSDNSSVIRPECIYFLHQQHMLKKLSVPKTTIYIYLAILGMCLPFANSVYVCVSVCMCVAVLPQDLLIIAWRNSCATNQSPFTGGRVIKVCSSHKIQCTWSNTIHSIHKLNLLGTHRHTNIHRTECTHTHTHKGTHKTDNYLQS